MEDRRKILGGVKPLNLSKSYEMLSEAVKFTPGGALGIRKPEVSIYGEYPVYFESGYDMHLVDVDGNDYIDYQAGWGPIVFGYDEKSINEKVYEKVKKGFCFTGIQPEKLALEKKLAEIIPCCEMSVITKTGSDAASIALRLARAYTGKSKIISWGYHGWHDWCTYPRMHDKSIPQAVSDLTLQVQWGDLEAMEETLKSNSDIACMFITPVYHELRIHLEGSREYLLGLRKLADTYGVVLIFDEIRTGFRMALAGAQEFYGVTPDIAVFGKAMANGYPISAVCGKKEIMAMAIKDVAISSTFFPNGSDIIAALTSINFMKENNVIEDIKKKTDYFKAGIDRISKKYGEDILSYGGLQGMPFIVVPDEANRKIFYTYLIRNGILFHPIHHGYMSYRHTYKDIDKTLAVVEEAARLL